CKSFVGEGLLRFNQVHRPLSSPDKSMAHFPGSCRRLRISLLQVILATIPWQVVLADPKQPIDDERLSASVSLSDLDLATPEGMRAARERVRKEALRLCRKF